MADYPIYNATKSGFESIEKEIDSGIEYINNQITELANSAAKMTEEQFKKAQQKITKQINKLIEKIKKKFEKQQGNANKKKEKLQWLQNLINGLTPNLSDVDAVLGWAKDVIQALKDISAKITEEIADVTLTSTYIAVEIPKLTLKLTNLANLSSKVTSLTKVVK